MMQTVKAIKTEEMLIMAKKPTNKRKRQTDSQRKTTKSPDAYNKQGLEKASRQGHHGAIKDFSKAIQLKPDYAETYYNRGVSKIALGEPEDAIEDFEEAIKINPEYVEAYVKRGFARGFIGEEKAAITDCNTAINLNRDLPKRTLSAAWQREI